MNANRLKQVLINKVNNSYWWHVPPRDLNSYKKRGKFLASTYTQAEFYGRPNIEPEKMEVLNPIFGFSEREILKQLFPKEYKKLAIEEDDVDGADWYSKRTELDSMMYEQSKRLGFDAIVLIGSTGRKSLEQGRKPCSIELNLLNV